MSKKKRFVISQSLNQGLSDTINAVKNNAGNVRFEVIALSRIEPDPDNPRELKISKEEIKNGFNRSTLFLDNKQKELENLQSLSETIRKKGLINPVVVYKYGEIYRLVAGERRFLASIIAEKDDIQARILNGKPKGLDLRLLQWVENTEREDLSLRDRIGNIKSILKEYFNESERKEMSTALLKELIGISLSQASCYMSILKSPKDLEEQIARGNINNLDKAAFISKIESDDLRRKAIESCVKGENLKTIRQLVDRENKIEISNINKLPRKLGRAATRINLGFTKNLNLVKKIIFSVLKDTGFKHIEKSFIHVNWDEYAEATRAFQKFLKLIEKESI